MENNLEKMKKTSIQRVLAEQRGMTIVELMIVLTIIASIMGVVGVYVFGALDKANIQEAKIQINKLSGQVEQYYLSSSPRQFPNSLEDLAAGPTPIVKKVDKDPWGNDFIYKKISNREFEIYSMGPDGSEGTEDDVRKTEAE
ncbi:MAG: type II secretion system protein GspG [bacterium]